MREALTEACGALALDDDLIISLFLRTHQGAENIVSGSSRGWRRDLPDASPDIATDEAHPPARRLKTGQAPPHATPPTHVRSKSGPIASIVAPPPYSTKKPFAHCWPDSASNRATPGASQIPMTTRRARRIPLVFGHST